MLLKQILRHAAEQPHKIAVQDHARRFTYAGLGAAGSRIAAALGESGAEPGALVAIYQQRDAAMVASILGVWLAGGAYTVVEAEGVADEHYHRLTTIGPDHVLTTREHADALSARGFRVCVIDAALDAAAAGAGFEPSTQPSTEDLNGSDLAYVLFTSGSTGVPKGVIVTHGNVAHYVAALAARLDVPPGLTFAHVSTMSADLGNTSLFLSLWTGGTLHVLDDHHRKDPAALLDYLAAHRVEVLKITPSHWEAMFALIRAGGTPRVAMRYLVLGGEALSARLAGAVLDAGLTDCLVNHYGPTETTVGITVFPLRRADRAALVSLQTVPIGLPLGETQLLVRREDGTFAASDARGELHVGGPSVSAGYRNNPEANARGFVTGIAGAARFYRTGDMVRIDARGVVHFLGRVDRQVKINGYRIELEQVERALKSLDGCQGAVALVLEIRGRQALAAAALARDGQTPEDLKRQLAAIVPAYLIPRVLRVLPALPLTPNGKSDLARVRALLSEPATGTADAVDQVEAQTHGQGAAEPLVDEVRSAWRQCLGHDRFGDRDDFFAQGGDSLDAIGVIARLQAAGHRISARAFLAQPTVAALAQAIRNAADEPASGTASAVPTADPAVLSAAQRLFFDYGLARPDHHNQALVFDLDGGVSAELLRRAFAHVCAAHPQLSARYARRDGIWQVAPDAPPEPRAALPALEVTELPATLGAEAVGVVVRRAGQALQVSLSLTQGRLFAAQLFRHPGGACHLLLCAHHVAVDAVSWRILVDDLTRSYAALRAGAAVPALPLTSSLPVWSQHLASAELLDADLAYWRGLPREVIDARIGVPLRGNLERHAKSVWLSFGRRATTALTQALPHSFGAPFHHILLAACLHVFDETAALAEPVHLVELESHGRISFDDAVDISRTAGWFTSAYPVALASVAGDLVGTVRGVDAALAAVPRLGVAYGVHRDRLAAEWGGVPVPRLCYNYLGQFEFRGDGALSPRPSTLSPGFARGYDNERVHEFKLTARLLDGQLVCDLGYSAERHAASAMRALMERIAALLLAALPAASTHAIDPAVSSDSAALERDFHTCVGAGSSAGLLTYRPAALGTAGHAAAPRQARRDYREILLSGATGFVGAYVLRELLRETDARVHCLVRAGSDAAAAARLASVFDAYFPDTPLAGFGPRVVPLAGDLAQPHLSLGVAAYDRLDLMLDAIYHFAADTRLFGADEALELHNTLATRHLIALAGGRRPKDLHHMSTLAVCGVNRPGQPVVFSEATLDVGQTFLNAYERTKFRAEQRVAEFASRGGRAFVYRSGNVSADSRSARFQHNAADNRFVQLLRAAAKLGRLPLDVGEAEAFSPVDLVARGIVALSLGAAQTGGVYHVDSPWTCEMSEVFEVLRDLGVPLEAGSQPSFAALFGSPEHAGDRDVALGYFWASRPARNVRFDHSRTLRLLERTGCRFERPRREWLRRFLTHLIETGALAAQSSLQT
ncbi:non-ribosomal peptide synthetase [Burkholderia plantarii]|uniref:non-ribosomal peptide synthetase n=1 Tax=Burkholderia plantarii TaxID=41899 RepID=UPI000870A267|nr:non-ribosomal peptide synthetase [Burkholderia plantarii]